jgi:hypothetical protein
VDANTDYYQSNGGSSLFRSFLGFVAINHIESEGGFYRVCPLVKETTAYIMMKPLLEENLDKKYEYTCWLKKKKMGIKTG